MKISASTNPPKVEDLPKYLSRLNMQDIDFVHVDVMDGKFVENKTFDYKMLPKLREVTSLPFDVHLMVEKPKRIVKKYIKNGAGILTVHYESFKNAKGVQKTLQNIRKQGAFAGLSLRPDTDVENILPLIPFADVLLVMSVMPGKSGQEFMPQTLDRLDRINSYLKENDLSVVLEVDGGINDKNILELKKRGVGMVVVGSYLHNSEDYAKAIKFIK